MLAMRLVVLTPLLLMLSALGACVNSESDGGPGSSFSPIEVTVRSANGADLSSSVPILHSGILLSPLQQRSSTTTPIHKCPQRGTYTAPSWCKRIISSQDYETLCNEPPLDGGRTFSQLTQIVRGRCAADEICVGSSSVDEDTPQAYCVSTDHFVQIGPGPSSGQGQGTGIVTAGFNGGMRGNNGSQVAVQAVFTSLDRIRSVAAVSAVMQAQVYEGAWRTVNSTYCLRCASVTLAPVAVAAQRVRVSVVMPDSMPKGLLWLATYPYL